MSTEQKKYVILGHVKYPGVEGVTGTIRVTIPAVSQLDAEAKFNRFVMGKAQVVVDSCREQNVGDELGKIFKDLGNLWQ